ncbi:MAG TPA: aromatic amino acid ammonia-lyase [Streptosporangiaceae bacterium]|nr:aromatic amino acid ammonia-lyase [Streptosporangiaceae bacterium]
MVVLDGASLTIDSLADVAEGGEEVALAPAARDRMAAAREVVEEALRSEAAVYGLTTALAERKSVVLDATARQGFSRFLIRGHLIAQGPEAAPAVVRAAMTCLVNGFAKGTAGVRPELAEMMVDALNRGATPAVRSLGSVGQADLGPMADLAEGLIRETGFVPADNEGLALVNNNAFATGWAALAELAAERLLGEAGVAAALDLEAFAGNLSILHPVVTEARPYPGTAAAIRRLRELLAGSYLFEPGGARNLQDPLTFRSIPQILGAARDAFGYVRATIETELNSAGCNPAVVLAERRIVSVGNLDIVPVATALDFARIALASVITPAAERTVKLLQRPLSGLPPGLAAEADTGEEALAEFAGAAQAIAAEARSLAHPVSFEVVSTSKAEGIEDRTTMAPLSARRLAEMADLSARVVALELFVAAQAIDLRGPTRLGEGTGRALRLVRELAGFTARGQAPPADLEPLVEAVRAGRFARAGLPGQ